MQSVFGSRVMFHLHSCSLDPGWHVQCVWGHSHRIHNPHSVCVSGIALTRSRVIFRSLEVTLIHSKRTLIAHAHAHPNFGTDGTP